MSDARHDLAADLFLRLMHLDSRARRDMLDRECSHDPDLRSEVDSLLAAHDGAGERLLSPAGIGLGHIPGENSECDARSEISGLIGQYRLLSVLGEGGMGVVYLAEGDRPKRRVALKVIRPGVTSKVMLKRFEREAQALARLQHPGVAAVYETGTADAGRGPQPFIAMELVDGIPLHQHVHERGLGVRHRIELIARVCEAVHHAHERGVVHRDLKPANILVSDEPTTIGSGSAERSHSEHATGHLSGVGRPKVLDFGIARFEDDRPAATVAT